jgi:hypothetical protein
MHPNLSHMQMVDPRSFFVGALFTEYSSGDTRFQTPPGGAGPGDFALLFETYEGATPAVTPTGWTLIGSFDIYGASQYVHVFSKILAAGDFTTPTSYVSVTFSGCQALAVWRSPASAYFIQSIQQTTDAPTTTLASFTPGSNVLGYASIYIDRDQFTSGEVTVAAPFVFRGNNAPATYQIALADYDHSTGGASLTWSNSHVGGSFGQCALMFELRSV